MNILLMLPFILFALSACSPLKQPPCHTDTPQCLRILYARPVSEWPKPHVDEGVKWREMQAAVPSAVAADAKVELGRQLFEDANLSSDRTVSCRSCHLPQYAFSDPNRVSAGVMGRKGRRNSISLLHLSEPQSFYFWDGRASSLHQQVLMPITDHAEMGMDRAHIVPRLYEAGYAPVFQTAFGREIDLEALSQALAAYLQTLQPEATRFDRFLLGDASALNDGELHGLHLFRTKARCMNCHHGKYLTDGLMHNLNQTLPGKAQQDAGLYGHTRKMEDWGKFKTPSLRNLKAGKPWFHHGMFTNLRGIVAIYNAGMPLPQDGGTPDPLIRPLNLNKQEMDDLTVFLEVL